MSPLPPEDFGPGTLGCQEALHMSAFLERALDEELCRHPSVSENSEWFELAKNARNLIRQLYQKIGDKHLGAL